jgi:branched-chain amino acid transport system ATP-binding protein
VARSLAHRAIAEARTGDVGRLEVRGLEVVYGSGARVLHGIDVDVAPGSVVALLGLNGAGKTTLLRAVSNLLGLHGGHIAGGTVSLGDVRLDRVRPDAIVRSGVSHVLEGRHIFSSLTVDENLRLGGHSRKRATLDAGRERVMALFPRLAERAHHTAGYLSGGEQQMLAIGRALMQSPSVLLLDEPSLGLAPLLVEQIRETIVEINRQGVSVLLVEQNAAMALRIADRAYVLEHGRVVRDAPGADLLADPAVRSLYVGEATGGRRARHRAARAEVSS